MSVVINNKPIGKVYNKFKHLDQLLSAPISVDDSPTFKLTKELWSAIKEAYYEGES
jgi:hypothetical protein